MSYTNDIPTIQAAAGAVLSMLADPRVPQDRDTSRHRCNMIRAQGTGGTGTQYNENAPAFGGEYISLQHRFGAEIEAAVGYVSSFGVA